ncbi:hypothetical protein, partial [Faecalibaculum rodentium]|uniref:hypothetical protein n=2 Tax=Faecalibaculum rodentium TaxID=1702221 RepID=UPI002589647A
ALFMCDKPLTELGSLSRNFIGLKILIYALEPSEIWRFFSYDWDILPSYRRKSWSAIFLKGRFARMKNGKMKKIGRYSGKLKGKLGKSRLYFMMS